MVFAKGTEVSSEKSRAEIETLVRKYGADQFMSGYDFKKAIIRFRCKGRHVMFSLALPNSTDDKFKRYSRGAGHNEKRCEDERRRLWRALLLTIKAKLESVASGISTFDSEFMPFILLPDGKTVGEHVLPVIDSAYATGKMMPLLPAFGETS